MNRSRVFRINRKAAGPSCRVTVRKTKCGTSLATTMKLLNPANYPSLPCPRPIELPLKPAFFHVRRHKELHKEFILNVGKQAKTVGSMENMETHK